jgi:hypothetical protein
MTDEEVLGLKGEYPDAFAVFYDRMFETPHSILIGNLLMYIPQRDMKHILVTLQKEIEHERRQENK